MLAHHGKKQASRDVDVPSLPMFSAQRNVGYSHPHVVPSPSSLDTTQTPIRTGPGQHYAQNASRGGPHSSRTSDVYSSRTTPSAQPSYGYQSMVTPVASFPPGVGIPQPQGRPWLGGHDEHGDSVFAVSALTNTSTSSAPQPLPVPTYVSNVNTSMDSMVPPPALNAAQRAVESLGQVEDMTLEAIDDNIANLMGVMNEVYSATEKQKRESAAKARQFEEKQHQLAGLLQRLTTTGSDTSVISPRQSPSLDVASPAIRRTNTLSPPRPSVVHHRTSSRTTVPGPAGGYAARSMSSPAKSIADPELEAESTRLSRKCQLLATELVTSVQNGQELQDKLKSSTQEISAREMENNRLRHELTGLKTKLDASQSPEKQRKHASTSPQRALSPQRNTSNPRSSSEPRYVQGTAYVVEEALPKKEAFIQEEATNAVLRDALIEKARLEEELRCTKGQLAESVTRESKLAVEVCGGRAGSRSVSVALQSQSQGQQTPVHSAHTPSVQAVHQILHSDDLLYNKPTDPSILALIMEEQHVRSQIAFDHALAWRQRCVHVSSKLAENVTHTKRVQSQHDRLQTEHQMAREQHELLQNEHQMARTQNERLVATQKALQEQPPPPPPPPPPQNTTATSPFVTPRGSPVPPQYTQMEVDALKAEWAAKITDLEGVLHEHLQPSQELPEVKARLAEREGEVLELERKVQVLERRSPVVVPSPEGVRLAEQASHHNKEKLRLQETIIDLETKLFLASSGAVDSTSDMDLDATLPADPHTRISTARRLHEHLCGTCKKGIQKDSDLSNYLQFALDGKAVEGYETLQMEVQRLRIDLVQMKERAGELETDNYELECVKESAETACEEARQRIAALETSRDAWWRECSSILRQMADRRRQASDSLKELEELRLEVQALRAENVRLNGSVTSPATGSPSPGRKILTQKVKDLQDEKSNLEDMLHSAFTESSAEVESLRRRLEEASAALPSDSAVTASTESTTRPSPKGSVRRRIVTAGERRDSHVSVKSQQEKLPARKPQLPVEATRAHLKKLNEEKRRDQAATPRKTIPVPSPMSLPRGRTPSKGVTPAATPTSTPRRGETPQSRFPRGRSSDVLRVDSLMSPTSMASAQLTSPVSTRRVSLSGSIRCGDEGVPLPAPQPLAMTPITSPRPRQSFERSRSPPIVYENDRMSPVIRGASRGSLARGVAPLSPAPVAPVPLASTKIGARDLGVSDVLDSPQGDELAVMLDAAGSPLSGAQTQDLLEMLQNERIGGARGLSKAPSMPPPDPITTVNIMLNVATKESPSVAKEEVVSASSVSSRTTTPPQRISAEARELVNEVEEEIGTLLEEIRSREFEVSRKERTGEDNLREREEQLRGRERALFVDEQVQILSKRMESSPYGGPGEDELHNLRNFVDRNVSASPEAGLFEIINPELRGIIQEASLPRISLPQPLPATEIQPPPHLPTPDHNVSRDSQQPLGILSMLQALSPNPSEKPLNKQELVRKLIHDLGGVSDSDSSSSSYTSSGTTSPSRGGRGRGRGRDSFSGTATSDTGSSTESSSSSSSSGDDGDAAKFIRRKGARRARAERKASRSASRPTQDVRAVIQTNPPLTVQEARSPASTKRRKGAKTKSSKSPNPYFSVKVQT